MQKLSMWSLVLVCAVAGAGSACKKGSENASGNKTTEPATAAPAAAPAAGPTKLDKLGLQIDVPAGVTVSDGIAKDDVMLMTNDLRFTLTIGPANMGYPETLEKAKADVARHKPTNIKEETLADGWLLTFDAADGSHHVDVRREIGGKALRCVTTAPKPEAQQAAVAACKSLRP